MCMCVCVRVCIVIAQLVACLHKEPSSEPQILIFPNEIIRILFQTMQSLSLSVALTLSLTKTRTQWYAPSLPITLKSM